MTKKHFIALADTIRKHNEEVDEKFTSQQIEALADFCAEQSPRFNRDTFINYIKGKCGSSGGKLHGKLRRSV